MIEDRELEVWREQWRSVAEPMPASQGEIRGDSRSAVQKKIKRQNLRFVLSNLVAAITVVAALSVAAWAVRKEPSPLRIGWAIGISVLALGAASYRVWVQRGTWRPETQSTRAFVELWHRRLMARIRLLGLARYLLPAWIVFCAVLAAANWAVIGPDVHAHARSWLGALIAIALILIGSLLWLAWYRRRKLAQLDEVKRILDELNDESC